MLLGKKREIGVAAIMGGMTARSGIPVQMGSRWFTEVCIE